jgi:hypothetical protein
VLQSAQQIEILERSEPLIDVTFFEFDYEKQALHPSGAHSTLLWNDPEFIRVNNTICVAPTSGKRRKPGCDSATLAKKQSTPSTQITNLTMIIFRYKNNWTIAGRYMFTRLLKPLIDFFRR